MSFTTAILVLASLVGASCGGPEPGAGADATTGVVVIVVDAVRADHLGTYGYARRTSPNIDARAARGVVFDHAYTTSPWTLPAFGSILTGRLPSGHGAGVEVEEDGGGARAEVAAARKFLTLDPGVPSVAEILDEHGFATGAFVTNPFLHPRFGLDRGFDDYDHFESSNIEVRRADAVIDLSLEWIDRHGDGPFFLLLHLFDPHLDYDAPAPFRGRFAQAGGGLEHPVQGLWPIRNRVGELSAAEREFIVAAYDEEIAFVDAQVERFLAGLEQREVLDRTLVVLTSDHGEELFDHGGFEHGHAMYEEVLRVPLILWGPAVEAGRVDAPVSLLDVVPTVLAAAGLEAPPGVSGVSLLSAASSRADPRTGDQLPRRGSTRDDAPSRETAPAGDEPVAGYELRIRSGPRGLDPRRPIVAERSLYGPEIKAILKWPHKAILEVDSGEARLFDLVADPGERDDLAAMRPGVLRALLGELADVLAAAGGGGAGAEAELDPELRQRLRALGYIR